MTATAPKPKTTITVVGKLEDKIDYGPIPDKTYDWGITKENNANPKLVTFELANGATIEMLPMKKGVFYMENDWRQGETHHKVTLTRPFWMSKFLVTANQLRDMDPNGYEDCRALEKAVPEYPVSPVLDRTQIDTFCRFLTNKYRKQIPEDYIFRLATAAEWEYAGAFDETKRHSEWTTILYASKPGRETMDALQKQRALNKIYRLSVEDSNGWGCGWTHDHKYFVGGRMRPFKNGYHDLVHRCSQHYDIENNINVHYVSEELDPLRWVAKNGSGEAGVPLLQDWELGRTRRRGSLSRRDVYHLILGPDLVAEGNWAKPADEAPRVVKRKGPAVVMPASARWNPKRAPHKLSRPHQSSFVMDNGAKMEFCLCPTTPSSGFRMSNVPGQDKQSHRVTITRPFWMTKGYVTAEQWRDFGPYDCEGLGRELESLFRKEKWTVCVRRNYVQWDRYCEHLTKRYANLLPPGYVFRLPTEAEMEWAMVADENGFVGELAQRRYCPEPRDRTIDKILKVNKFVDAERFSANGYFAYCIGGRLEPNAWGIQDLWYGKGCLDYCDVDIHRSLDMLYSGTDIKSAALRAITYEPEMSDPLRWDGRLAHRWIARPGTMDRHLSSDDHEEFAHIVVGQDLVSELRRNEEADHPVEDFGGRFLGDHARVTDISSRHMKDAFNSPDHFKRLLSRENTLVRTIDKGEDLRGCHTEKEDEPWVKIELDQVYEITGVQVENYNQPQFNRHLQILVSTEDDDKHWIQVAFDKYELRRHRFDLQGKKVKAKYILVRREPGFVNNFFALNKVLIYGK